MKTCNVCGATLNDGLSKCPYCGAHVCEKKVEEVKKVEPVKKDDLGSVIDLAKKSVVKVIAIISPEQASFGSGCVLENGYICTNAHVVVMPNSTAICQQIGVQFLPEISDMIYPVEVVAFSAADDVAILMPLAKLPNTKGMPLGDSNTVKMGEKVFTIGNPENQDFSYNEGVVSNPNRVHNQKLDPVIQTNIEFNHGNSGGPLINLDGKVMGMATYSLVEQLQTNVQNVTSFSSLRGMGFCVSSNTIKKIINKIK